jgi:non-heme chloroperoxidase
MDHYAADAAAVVEHLNLSDAVHIGHSAGGGVVARYVARHGKRRVAKAVLISAVTPIVLKTATNPDGLTKDEFDGLRNGIAINRAKFYRDVPAGPFYGFNRPNAKAEEGVIDNWWRQGMMGGAKAQYDSVKAITETDLSEDLKQIDVPTLVLHGEDDQIVPYKSAFHAVKFLSRGTLKTYPGFPHGMPTTHADVINKDVLDFIRA